MAQQLHLRESTTFPTAEPLILIIQSKQILLPLNHMKAMKRFTIILIVSAFVWMGFEVYQLLNSDINFFQLKKVPISIAFFVSALLFGLSTRLKFNLFSLILFVASVAVLSVALYSNVSHVILFKVESSILLVLGAHTFRMLSIKKPILFSIIYYATVILIGITILNNSTNAILQIIQGFFMIATTVCVFLTLTVKKFS